MPIVRFVRSAIVDITTARAWYDSEQTGLGAQFVDAVEVAAARLLVFPDAGPTVYDDIRRVLVERFPYVLYYRHDEASVVVVACLHAARGPEYRVRRLESDI